MATRRCFSQKVLDSDAFICLSDSVQTLYIRLCMAADDDGFVNCAAYQARQRECREAGLDALVANGFLIFVEGVYVITHWRISNSLKNDRSRLPGYPAAAKKLYLDESKAYQLTPNGPSLWELREQGMKKDSKEFTRTDASEAVLDSVSDSQKNRTELNRTEQNLTEPNRTEPKRTEPNPTELKSTQPNTARRGAYNALAAEYPAHRRDDAFGAYCRAVGVGEEWAVRESLKRWKASEQWKKDRFIPRLSNWLERGLWRTTPEPSGQNPSGCLGKAELEAIAQILRE